MTVPNGWNAVMAMASPWLSFLRSATTVTTTATAIPSTALVNRAGLWVFNAGTVSIYLGDSAVGTSNEFILFPNQTQLLPFSDAITLYGRVAAGTAVCVSWQYVS